MDINSSALGLSNAYYQASAQNNNPQNAINEAAKNIASGAEKLVDNTGYSTETVGKLLNILV